MRLGGWPSTVQRPIHTHATQLSTKHSPHAGKPWIDPSSFPGLVEFIAALEGMTPELLQEYERVLTGNFQQNSCNFNRKWDKNVEFTR